jgi:hypothetical protein
MRSKHLGLLMGIPLALSGCPFAPRCWETATCPIVEDAASDAAGPAENEASVVAFMPTAISDGSVHDAAVSTPSAAPAPSTPFAGDADGSAASRADAFVVPSAKMDAGDADAQALPSLPLCDSASDRLCTEECPCASGEGLCASDAECQEGTVCTAGSGPKFGRDADTCLPAHCDNDRQDSAEGETSVDCGGECGCRARVYEVPIPDEGTLALNDISGDGSLVVGGIYLPENLSQAFAWTVGEPKLTLLSEGTSAVASLVSDDGNFVVGLAGTCIIQCGGDAVGWSLPSLEHVELPGDLGTVWVGGVSASGVVIVGQKGNRPGQGVVWTQGTYMLFDELLSAVSGSGLVVAQYGAVMNLTTRAVEELELLPNATGMSITSLNQDGAVAVGRTSLEPPHPFRWQRGIGSSALAEGNGQASDVSADGATVVGELYTDAAANEAFIWDATGDTRLLSVELIARGLELPADRILTAPVAISADGTTILLGSGEVVVLD